MFFGKPGGRTLTWSAVALVVLVAAVTAAAVVYLTAGDGAEGGQAAGPRLPVTQQEEAVARSLRSVVPSALWRDCYLQRIAEQNADETAVCLPSGGLPDRWEISSYRNGVAVEQEYNRLLALHKGIRRDSGRCNARSWGGERRWLHGPGKPGGRYFCYFDGNEAVVVWTHARLDQPSHKDILVIAREDGSDHASLTYWWNPWHHRIGKAG